MQETDVRDIGLIPAWRRSPGGGHGNPLQYSWLENPMDRGTWRATVYRVAQSQTRLKQLGTHTRYHHIRDREIDIPPKVTQPIKVRVSIHTVKGFSVVDEVEVDVFLELPCFLHDPVNVDNLISGSSAFSKPSL